jgi:hypothetical protein
VILSNQPIIEPDSVWQKTPYTNLVRFKPSPIYFARFRVEGKLIRHSLKTSSLSVAKLRLSDFEKTEQQKPQRIEAVASGIMTFGAAQLYSVASR